MPFCYEYPRAALAVDCCVFGVDEGALKILLIRRGIQPFAGCWALPGGFVRLDETLEEAARRELREETGLERVSLEQLGAFSELDRDPRERVVSFAFSALVKLAHHQVRAATDARDADWFPVKKLPALAFDHTGIIVAAVLALRKKTRHEPVGFELLPARFTLTQLQKLYETILEKPLDKRNFRKKVLQSGLVVALDAREENVAHRAARLYRFKRGHAPL